MVADRKAAPRALRESWTSYLSWEHDNRVETGELPFAYNPARGGICTMKKPSKTAAELEASIKVEMEDICDWPTDMTISVQPDGDSWKVTVMQEKNRRRRSSRNGRADRCAVQS